MIRRCGPSDITAEAGLATAAWATSACFFDFDRDGWLDLVFVNYVDYDPSRTCSGKGGKQDFCGPQMFGGSVPQLYRNLGRRPDRLAPHGVRFENVTLASVRRTQPGATVHGPRATSV